MDFTFDDEQLALQEVARGALERECGPELVRAAGRRPGGHDARPCGRRWSISDGPACWCPGRRAPAPACSRCASCSSRWAASRCPGPFFSSAVAATAGRPGARRHRAPRRPGRRQPPRDGRAAGAGARRAAGHRADARARRKGAGGCVTGDKPIVVDGHTRRLGHRGGAQRGGRALLPARGRPHGRARPVARPHPQAGPPGPRGRAGRCRSGPRATRRRCGGGSRTTSRSPWPPRPSARPTGPWPRRSPTRRSGSSSTSRSPPTRPCAIGSSRCSNRSRWPGPGSNSPPGRRTPRRPSGARPPPWRPSYAAEAGVRVTGDDIQLHGGVGFTWANDAHFLFKRVEAERGPLGRGGRAAPPAGVAVHRVGVSALRAASGPGDLAERYRAEGAWDDRSLGQFLSDALLEDPTRRFRIWSPTHPYLGTVGDVYEESLPRGRRPACPRARPGRRRRLPVAQLGGGGDHVLRLRHARRDPGPHRALLRAQGGRLHPAPEPGPGPGHRVAHRPARLPGRPGHGARRPDPTSST